MEMRLDALARICILDTQVPDLVSLHQRRKNSGEYREYKFTILNDEDIDSESRKPLILLPISEEYIEERERIIKKKESVFGRTSGVLLRENFENEETHTRKNGLSSNLLEIQSALEAFSEEEKEEDKETEEENNKEEKDKEKKKETNYDINKFMPIF